MYKIDFFLAKYHYTSFHLIGFTMDLWLGVLIIVLSGIGAICLAILTWCLALGPLIWMMTKILLHDNNPQTYYIIKKECTDETAGPA